MRTQKGIVAGLVALCLVGAPLVAQAAAAGKPKGARAARTFYLVNANDSGCEEEGQFLRLAPGSATASLCANVYDEVWTPVFGDPCYPAPLEPSREACAIETFTADEGLPLRLDTSRAITGTIYTRSLPLHSGTLGASAGPTTLNVTLRAATGRREIVLGMASVDYLVTPTESRYEVPFEITPRRVLDRRRLTGLSIELWNGGVAPLHGMYEPDTSSFAVPVAQ